MKKPRIPGQSAKRCWSDLLTKEENARLWSLIEIWCPTHTALAAAVIQLYVPEPPAFTHWAKAHCGVLCVTSDRNQDCYIKLFCLIRRRVLWELKMEGSEHYQTPETFFHIVTQSQKSQYGMNFADECEAHAVLSALRSNLLDKRRSALNRRLSKSEIGLPTNFKLIRHISWDREDGSSQYNIDKKTSEHFVNGFHLNSLPRHYISKIHGSIMIRKRKITKKDIGMPFDLRHLTHIRRDERPI